jgi:hypothetical protein
MSKSIGIAARASLLVAFGLMLSVGASLEGQAASGGGKGYHTNAAEVKIPKACAGIPTTNPARLRCVADYPKPDKFQKVIMGGYWLD